MKKYKIKNISHPKIKNIWNKSRKTKRTKEIWKPAGLIGYYFHKYEKKYIGLAQNLNKRL